MVTLKSKNKISEPNQVCFFFLKLSLYFRWQAALGRFRFRIFSKAFPFCQHFNMNFLLLLALYGTHRIWIKAVPMFFTKENFTFSE